MSHVMSDHVIRANEQITFRGLAQTAGVSLDFLYRCAPIRQRVEHLRAQQQNTPPPKILMPLARRSRVAETGGASPLTSFRLGAGRARTKD
jgi:Family of unknown function (DUF6262)